MYDFGLSSYERLTPSEKRLQEQFFSTTNTANLVAMVRARVDDRATDGDVVDLMHEIFTKALGGKTKVDNTATLNKEVISTLTHRLQSSREASLRSRRIGFETHKIPSTILPRASFSIEPEREVDTFFLR